MSSELIDPATAGAAGEAAKAAGKAIDLASKFGSFLGRILGTIPEDAVGLVVGDPLHHVRLRNCAKLEQRTEEILRERKVFDPISVSPSVAIPLLEAAKNESREELQELWARLLAAAMDPSRNDRVRQSFIDTLKRLDPVDALMLSFAYDVTSREIESKITKPTVDYSFYIDALKANPQVNAIEVLAKRFGLSGDAVIVSFENLRELKLFNFREVSVTKIINLLTPAGRMFMKALYD